MKEKWTINLILNYKIWFNWQTELYPQIYAYQCCDVEAYLKPCQTSMIELFWGKYLSPLSRCLKGNETNKKLSVSLSLSVSPGKLKGSKMLEMLERSFK